MAQKGSDVSNRPCTCFVKKSSPITGQSILLVRNGVLSGIVFRVFHKVKDRVRWSIGRNPRIHAIWTPQCGWEKGKMCFIKRKDKTFVSNHRDLQKKIVVIFREDRSRIKTSGLFLECRPLSSASSLYFEKRWVFSCLRFGVLFYLSRVGTPKQTRACTSRTQQVRNSCLHPSPSPVMS